MQCLAVSSFYCKFFILVTDFVWLVARPDVCWICGWVIVVEISNVCYWNQAHIDLSPLSGRVSTEAAEGVWDPTEDVCTLLRPDHHQQWNWRDHPAPWGSHGFGVQHSSMGSCLLGLLDLTLSMSPLQWSLTCSPLCNASQQFHSVKELDVSKKKKNYVHDLKSIGLSPYKLPRM